MHAEVVLFTAGLEDYAKPIADELDRRYGDVFHHRLYRPATRNCSAYPCLKVCSCAPHSHLITTAPRNPARQPAGGICRSRWNEGSPSVLHGLRRPDKRSGKEALWTGRG